MMSKSSPLVGCYYFPNYHITDARNQAFHGSGWSEWELVKKAIPRFAGHRQPKIPVWGYQNEAEPAVMAQKIAAAADHGIDYFIFDYYYYNDGPFLENCLNDGFLTAANVDRIKFALMWANHDWLDIHPCGRVPRPLLYPGRVTPETFDILCSRVIEKYFRHPSYLRIEGGLYFSIYHLEELIHSFGSLAAARRGLDRFRELVAAANLGKLHLNAVFWGEPVLPCDGKMQNQSEIIAALGFDSVTSYVWVHHVALPPQNEIDYQTVCDSYFKHWDKTVGEFAIPYYPNVTVGWDSSPRTLPSDVWSPDAGYPYTATIANNTPENFEAALLRCKQKMTELGIATLNINCWNEWTEGSMLEPEAEHGYGYLQAVKKIFG